MSSTETPRHGLPILSVDAAAGVLRAGGLVAFPTETVYGLGARADRGEAVARIYAAKGRPAFNPLIVHVADTAEAETLAVFDEVARAMAARFWPGPLTLVLPLRAGHGLSSLVTAGLATVGLRVPGTALARDLIGAVGTPLAAPSANPSGGISPTRVEHVQSGLSGRIEGVIDGGACAVGLESTILATDPPVLLREGGVPAEEIEAALGHALTRDTTPGDRAGAVTAPGQLTSHYAPDLPVRLNIRERSQGAVLLGFGPIAGDLTLSASGDPTEAAANLFAHLHTLDAMGRGQGALTLDIAPIPDVGLGRAINDRLRRAAAPRPGMDQARPD